ncbi:MAG: hypothetical protein LBE38_09590 [Deltaproteobacteria bacterium]|nr:hypothetical protein [Deltaproteobacteria bacterium]
MTVMGLRDGIIGTLTERLVNDPQNLEIVPLGIRDYPEYMFTRLAQLPDVAYVVPDTRIIAYTISLSRENYPNLQASAKSTTAGDPILATISPEMQIQGPQLTEIFISKPVAENFQVKEGDIIVATITRNVVGHVESEKVNLTVKGIFPLHVLNEKIILASLDFLKMVSDYQEDYAVPEMGWEGTRTRDASNPILYQSFRLYAKDMDSVERLRLALNVQGIDVITNAKRIADVKRLDRAFTIVFLTLLLVVGIGALASAISGSFDLVGKNRKSLACLALLGVPRGRLQLFSTVQAAISGFFSAIGACGLFFLVGNILNNVFTGEIENLPSICSLSITKLLISVVVVVVFMILASLCAYSALSDIEPSEGMRDV